MDAFPAFFPLAGRKVVVVGSGAAADNKARLFDGSPAVVLRLEEAEADTDAFAGASLVFIASHDRPFIERTAAAARAAGAVVNVVDHPALCDFYTPAIVDRGAVVAAVGASGAAPMLAAMLRNDIEAQVPEGAGRVAVLFRLTRDVVREALPDIDERRAFLREALTGPAAQTAMAGDLPRAESLLRQALAEVAADGRARAMGRVDFIVGEGSADLLSLRAVRALGQAEALIVDPRCPPEIAAVARRDARRLTLAESATLKLVELAGEGLRIVIVRPESPDAAVLAALRLAGVGADVLRQAPA